MEKYVITISRQFASMGRCIAQSLSEELGIPFYDRDIVEQTAKRMELPISTISQEEENVRSVYFKRQYPLGMGIQSMQDEIYMVQQNIIRDLAEREPCIFVGRCSDSILADHPRRLSVFIYAPYRVRYENCIKRLGMMPSVAEKMIKNVDKSRIQYHRRYCKGYQDELTGKDLAIDSGRFGIEGAAQIIKSVMWANGIIG
jgi:cytidylate kinase